MSVYITASVVLRLPVVKSIRELDPLLDNAVRYAQSITPVDTGLMRDSWYSIPDAIVNEVDYFSYVDQGTRYIEGRFMSDQVEAYIDRLAENFIIS